MTAMLVVTLVAVHSSFLWARVVYFRIDGPTHFGVRVIEMAGSASVLIGAALILVRSGDYVWTDTAALLVSGLSAALFVWGLRTVRRGQLTAAFSTDAPVEIVSTGAYRRIRNPFYMSYLLAHAMPVLASRSPWSLLPLACMVCIYLRAALLEERKFLNSPLANQYRCYQRRSGRFTPRFFNQSDG